jgi:hypothetical protein
MDKKIKVIIWISAFLFSTATPVVYASLIAGSDNTYVIDTNTNLSWLKLSLTNNKTVQDALNTYSGWSLATEAQFHTMFNSVAGPSGDSEILGFDVPDSQYVDEFGAGPGQEYIYSTDGSANYLTNGFSLMMGYTSDEQFGNKRMIATTGVYKSSDNTLTYGGVIASQDLTGLNNDSHNDFLYSFYDWSENYDFLWKTSKFGMGIYLVRDDTTPVPEPHILALFGAGLLGLGVVARRRKIRQP